MAISSAVIKNRNSVIQVALVPSGTRPVPFTVTTSAAALTAATTLTVTAITDTIPAGSSLIFGAVTAVVTSTAASGATSIAVAPLSAGIPSGTSTTFPTLLTLQGGTNIQPKYTTQSVDTSSYGDGLATDSAKVSAGFSVDISGIVLASDTTFTSVISEAGGSGVNGDREVYFKLTLGDGRNYTGYALIENLSLDNALRDILRYSFTLMANGSVTPSVS